MLKTTFFIAMCLGCIHGKKGEPLRVAYCKKFCLNKKHQACGCELRKGVSEPETMSLLITFRRAILAQHNKLRNKLASGKEDYNGSSSAADMMALSYSLELENMARCYLRSKFVGEDLNPCLGMANGQSVEQIVSMQNSLDVTDLQTHTIIKQWYGEIKNMKPEYYEKRPNPKYYNGL
ncbi:CRISP/Allergen/PR-1-like Protein [Tribolium castaneum]|uniref:CRISP/Allergen/PR-1-like Protein n=1 Tax=Tribolium castaneum TaxID=7070 RepID=A0A139WM60_TRICA|nr:CRISP/Allergen/PR-1-like Protein [Tribolium castaneum]